jgi:tight adherence protein B
VDVEPDGAPKILSSNHAASDATAPEQAAPEQAARALRAAGRLAHRSGAPLADVLETVVATERARERAEVARSLALAGPEASGLVLQWLPVAGWALAAAVDTESLRILARTPLGWMLLGLGGGLWFAGRRWIRALTATARKAGSEGEPAGLPLALAEAAIGAGLDLRTAIDAVGTAVGGSEGAALVGVARALASGASWEAAWAEAGPSLQPLHHALRSSWMAGASPVPMLAAARETVVERARADAERAAAVLGVRVALPLALCLLPSFVVVGVVPLLLAVAFGAGIGSIAP